MFQTACTAADAAPGGICAGGKVGAHAFSHLVSLDGGARWRRIRDALIPTPGSPYDGMDGDCDGTVSFPEGIGPVVMWGADCGTGKWPPPPGGHGNAPTNQTSAPLQLGDYPRVAAAFAANASDPLLTRWTKSPNNPIAWADPTFPAAFPGRVWRSDAGGTRHWNMLGAGMSTHSKGSPWTRYETTDPTLHGPWVLKDAAFATTSANAPPLGGGSTPGFYSLPNPAPGDPTHVINGGGVLTWA